MCCLKRNENTELNLNKCEDILVYASNQTRDLCVRGLALYPYATIATTFQTEKGKTQTILISLSEQTLFQFDKCRLSEIRVNRVVDSGCTIQTARLSLPDYLLL